MIYEIPIVIDFGSASRLIQGDGKGIVLLENVTGDSRGTPAAYESDE